jgi:hypothetical protein
MDLWCFEDYNSIMYTMSIILIHKILLLPSCCLNKSKIVNAIEYQNQKLGILRLWQQPNILKKVKAILITGL